MVKKFSIGFRQAESPITEPVTKFGGQPVWIGEPSWPVSRKSGAPMRFICQVRVDPELFGDAPGRMAYVFMSDWEDGLETWDPESGENAVVIQSGPRDPKARPSPAGPSLFRMVDDPSGARRVAIPCEYAVELFAGEDPEYADEGERRGWAAEANRAYAEAVRGTKLGGTPDWLQWPEYPRGGPWRLLLRIDLPGSARTPFQLNFGTAGIGFAFLSEDGATGKFLWQDA
jgi:hypothetical protein